MELIAQYESDAESTSSTPSFTIIFPHVSLALMLQLLIMVAAGVYVVVNLIVDILYAVIDPRVRTR